MPANLELKTSDYTEHAITMYYNGYSLHWFVFLVVHIATYVPSSITRDAVSAAGMVASGHKAFPEECQPLLTVPPIRTSRLSYWKPFVYSLG